MDEALYITLTFRSLFVLLLACHPYIFLSCRILKWHIAASIQQAYNYTWSVEESPTSPSSLIVSWSQEFLDR